MRNNRGYEMRKDPYMIRQNAHRTAKLFNKGFHEWKKEEEKNKK